MADIELERSTNAPIQLEGAILLYGAHSKGFAMWARFEKGKLRDPEPVCDSVIERFVNRVRREARTWTSEHTLAVSEGDLLWWSPRSQRRLYFQTGSDKYLDSLSGGLFPVPSMVWRWSAGQLRVWALEGNQRPSVDTLLYRAPYFNLTDNHVCLGSSKMPQNPTATDQSAVESGFFSSSFTHTHQSCLKDWPGTQGEFWHSLRDSDHFPSQHLRPTSKSLHATLETLAGSA